MQNMCFTLLLQFLHECMEMLIFVYFSTWISCIFASFFHYFFMKKVYANIYQWSRNDARYVHHALVSVPAWVDTYSTGVSSIRRVEEEGFKGGSPTWPFGSGATFRHFGTLVCTPPWELYGQVHWLDGSAFQGRHLHTLCGTLVPAAVAAGHVLQNGTPLPAAVAAGVLCHGINAHFCSKCVVFKTVTKN